MNDHFRWNIGFEEFYFRWIVDLGLCPLFYWFAVDLFNIFCTCLACLRTHFNRSSISECTQNNKNNKSVIVNLVKLRWVSKSTILDFINQLTVVVNSLLNMSNLFNTKLSFSENVARRKSLTNNLRLMSSVTVIKATTVLIYHFRNPIS